MSTPDFFRARLDQMIDLRHPLAVLATRMPWQQIEASVAPLLARKDRRGRSIEGADLFGPTLQVVGAGVSAAGRPRLAIQLMVSLLYLKHAYGLSDEAVVERWAENVVWQFFSGQEYYEPRLPCDATQIGRFRRVLGEAGVEELLAKTIEAAVQMQAVRKSELQRVIVDTTVQEKAVAYPTDSRLLEVARAKVVQLAQRAGLRLKQTFEREGRSRARSHQRHRGLLELRQELALHVSWRAPAILPPVPGRSLLPVQSPAREPATLAVQASQADLHPGTTSNSGPERLGNLCTTPPTRSWRRVQGQYRFVGWDRNRC